jgi:peptidoglycan hydrolase CwlO-like protein
MTRFLTLIIVVLFPVLLLAQNNFDSLLKELDNTVDNYQLYSSRKEGEINKLKENLKQNATNIRSRFTV